MPLEPDLRGRTALVTGSSSGLGADIARSLGRQGCLLFVHGRNRERAEVVAHAIEQEGGQARVAIGDLADQGGVDAVLAACDGGGAIDILINNAGAPSGDFGRPWEELSADEWLRTYQGNVVGPAMLARAVLPGMLARNWGRIVQIASAVGIQPTAVNPEYSASKAALINMSVSLARRLTGTAVTSNSISPGIMVTEVVRGWLDARIAAGEGSGLSVEELERRIAREELGADLLRLGRPADISHVILMLVSPLADFITGANIRVDGGQVLAVN